MHTFPCPVSLATVCSIAKLASVDTKDDLLPVFVFLANAIHWATPLPAELLLEELWY